MFKLFGDNAAAEYDVAAVEKDLLWFLLMSSSAWECVWLCFALLAGPLVL